MTMKKTDVGNGKYHARRVVIAPRSKTNTARTYVQNLLNGDAVSTGNVMSQATEAALKRYRAQTLHIKTA